MKRLRETLINALACVGAVALFINATSSKKENYTTIVKLEYQQFKELKRTIEMAADDINIKTIGRYLTGYFVTEEDGKFLLNVKNH